MERKMTMLLWEGRDLVGECAEIVEVYTLVVLMDYLTSDLGYGIIPAAMIINIWTAVRSIMSLVMFFILQEHGCYYSTFLASFCIKSIGFGLLVLSAQPFIGRCGENSVRCIGQIEVFQVGMFFVSLGISFRSALPSNAIKRSEGSEKEKASNLRRLKQIKGFFTLIAVIALPTLPTRTLRFGTPAICHLIAALIFLTGIFSDKGVLTKDNQYSDGTISQNERDSDDGTFFLEEIRSGVLISIADTFFIEQAKNLDPDFLSLKLDVTFLRQLREYGIEEGKELWFQKIYGPFLFVILCYISAASVETIRLGVVRSHGLEDKPDETIPMSMAFLAPQFFLLGFVVGRFNATDEKMYKGNPDISQELHKKVINGIMVAAATGLIWLVGNLSEEYLGKSWFQDTLNSSRFDYFYWLMSAECSLWLVVELVQRYRRRPSDPESIQAPLLLIDEGIATHIG